MFSLITDLHLSPNKIVLMLTKVVVKIVNSQSFHGYMWTHNLQSDLVSKTEYTDYSD